MHNTVYANLGDIILKEDISEDIWNIIRTVDDRGDNGYIFTPYIPIYIYPKEEKQKESFWKRLKNRFINFFKKYFSKSYYKMVNIKRIK